MGYESVNVHKETYKINGEFFTVIADFLKDVLFIKWKTGSMKFPLDDYTNFEGNMETFVKSKVLKNVSIAYIGSPKLRANNCNCSVLFI